MMKKLLRNLCSVIKVSVGQGRAALILFIPMKRFKQLFNCFFYAQYTFNHSKYVNQWRIL